MGVIHIANGYLDWDYTGLAKNKYGWWYITNGVLDWNYNGYTYDENGYAQMNDNDPIPEFSCIDGIWGMYMSKKIDTTYTGLANNENGWFYICEGGLDWNYTGLASNEYGWWYITNGVLDWDYNGYAYDKFGNYYKIENGYAKITKTNTISTFQCINGIWGMYIDDKIDITYTGLANNENGWFYICEGRLDWNYTGFTSNEYGWWYIENGVLNWDYTGYVTNNNENWYVHNGFVIQNRE